MSMLSERASVRAAVEASGESELPTKPIRVMIVDDSAVVRGLVSRWIGEEPGLEVVAHHANGRLAVDDIVRSAADIVLLDIEMPVMDGLEALPLLLQARPELRVLIVSTLTRRNAEISFKALALGALDYVPKPDTNREITTSLDFRHEVIRKIKLLGRARLPQARGGAGARTGAEPEAGVSRLCSIPGRFRWCRRGSSRSARPAARRCWRAYLAWLRRRWLACPWSSLNTCRRCSPGCWPSAWRGRPAEKPRKACRASCCAPARSMWRRATIT